MKSQLHNFRLSNISTNIKIFIGILALGLFVFSCKTKALVDDSKKVKIALEPKSGSNVKGTAEFVDDKGEVNLEVKLTGLVPGVHAIHIHEKADCSAADAASAGGHWNPTFKKHGKWTDAEHHKGDIGNFTADIDGNATILFKTDEWCIGCGDPTKDILGKGLIIHEKADDFTTQPTGNAGGRVACSAIIQ